MTLEALRAHRQEILKLAARYGGSNVRVFGSVARNEQTPLSDIDVLIRFRRGTTLFDLTALEEELEILLRCQVDVVSEGGLNEFIQDRVLSEAVEL